MLSEMPETIESLVQRIATDRARIQELTGGEWVPDEDIQDRIEALEHLLDSHHYRWSERDRDRLEACVELAEGAVRALETQAQEVG